jgi:hypothetical protein
MNKETPSKSKNQKICAPAPSHRVSAVPPVKKSDPPRVPVAGINRDRMVSLQEASTAVHQLKLNAQRELELARKMRTEAQRYQLETATRARSDAQQLILRTRLATQRETEELVRQASEEIQKVLADIRMIRIMAQEELAAQRKFTDAARIRSMSISIQNSDEKPDSKKKRQAEAIK